MTGGMELPNQEKIRKLEENDSDKYFGILESDATKLEKMKGNIEKEDLRRNRKLLETKLNCRNIAKKNKYVNRPSRKKHRTFFFKVNQIILKKWTKEQEN